MTVNLRSWIKEHWREFVALIPLAGSYILAIPPVQSTSLSELRLMPNGGIAFVLYVTAVLVAKKASESFLSVAARSALFLVLIFVIFLRVRMGMLE